MKDKSLIIELVANALLGLCVYWILQNKGFEVTVVVLLVLVVFGVSAIRRKLGA